MSEVTNPLDNTEDDLKMPSELEVLKERAKLLSITHSNNITVETLRKKIEDKLAGEPEEPVTPVAPLTAPVSEEAAAEMAANASEALAQAEAPAPAKTPTLRNYLLAEATKLIRIRINCMDPKKQDLPGEFFTVANEHIGTVRKYVPFGEQTEGGYHVPACILDMLRTREFLSITTTTHPVTKAITTKTRYIKEFAIEVLPPLTPAELKQLAADQSASGRLEDRD